jgi:hypothetical protein
MFAHYSMSLVVMAMALVGPTGASEAPVVSATAGADASGFLAAKTPRVFAVNPAAVGAGAFAGVPKESVEDVAQEADVAPPQSLPAGKAAPVTMSDGSGEAFETSLPQQAGAMAGAGAMPAAPGGGGSDGTSTVFTAVGITVLVMALCCCAVAYCCCKELFSCFFGDSGDGKIPDAGDYDMGNMAEAGPLVGSAF